MRNQITSSIFTEPQKKEALKELNLIMTRLVNSLDECSKIHEKIAIEMDAAGRPDSSSTHETGGNFGARIRQLEGRLHTLTTINGDIKRQFNEFSRKYLSVQ